MKAEAERETREGSAGLEEASNGALVGESGVAEHGKEMAEGEEGIGVSGDEGSPGDDIGRWDLVEEAEGVGQEFAFGVEGDEAVAGEPVGLTIFDSLGMEYSWVGVGYRCRRRCRRRRV